MDVIFWSGGFTKVNYYTRYIGPYKIAHWMRKHGYETQVIDHVDQADDELLYEITKQFITNKTIVIGLSTTFLATNSFKWDNGSNHMIPEFLYKVAKKLKEEHPRIKFIMGGYMSDKFPSYDIFDASIMSYTTATDDIFLEYVNHLRLGTPAPSGNLIFPLYSKGKYRIHYDRAREPKYNIESDDFRFTENDHILPGEVLPLDVSRGCIFACRFCQFPHLGKKKLDYIRGMNYIEEELRYNYEKFGTTSYYILDDTFNDTEIKMQQFYNMSQRLPFKLNYSAYIRADLVHRFLDTAHLLKESGLFGAYHGIESFHPEASKIVGKGWSGQHGKEWLPTLYHDIWKQEVAQHVNFIIGITKDTKENIDSTVDWFIDNDMHSIKFHPLGLFGPDLKNSRHTIQSEFDRNIEKYGYTIIPGGKHGRINWKNDNWTLESSSQEVINVMNKLAPYRRCESWGAPALLWYGFSKKYLMSTPRYKLPNNKIKNKTADYIIQYFDILSNIGGKTVN